MRYQGGGFWLAAVGLIAGGLTGSVGALPAQTPTASAFEHSCTDCHLRDHDLPVRGSEVVSNPAQAFLVLVPGLTLQSANCLECHSTEEQRAARIGFEVNDFSSVDGGLYVGGSLDRGSHPLGRERTLGRWGSGGLPRSSSPSESPPVYAGDRLRSSAGENIDCADCHAPHGYDLSVGYSSDERSVCLECHDSAFYAFQDHLTPVCGDCHRQHGAPGLWLTHETDPDVLCARCHEGSGRMPTELAPVEVQGPPAHLAVQPGRCTDCHKIHGEPGVG